MKLNIDDEMQKFNKFTDGEIDLDIDDYAYGEEINREDIIYLLCILQLTQKYEKIEIYLKQLLNNFDNNKLTNVDYYCSTILHNMMLDVMDISLNSFKMMLKFNIDINITNKLGYTALHNMYDHKSDDYDFKYTNSILNLFIDLGAELNIINIHGFTILDTVTYNKFTEESKICIMTLIDAGAKTNKPNKNNIEMYEFIKSYECQKIKLAIKK